MKIQDYDNFININRNLNNRNFRMFLARDFSKQNIKKDLNIYQTLRSCTSQKKLLVFSSPTEFIKVGAYKYRQQDLLGKGFSSKVYKASHINNSDERFAIKVINLKKFKASNIAMLQSQIEVHRTLSHPNVVQFYDAYKTQNFYYIITQYCPHGDLMGMLNQKKKLQESKAQNIIQQIIQGYTYLSKKSILHRDLKPANIFRSGDIWKIGDFGFSIISKSQYYFDKINVGTPLYMPPQSLKTNKYSFKSDIFSIGIILFQLITGRTPWQCKTQKQLLNKMRTQKPKIPEVKNPDIKRFISRACQVQQNQRLSINQFYNFFNPACSFTNPEQKQNQPKTLKNILSMKNIRQHLRMPMNSPAKNTAISLSSKQIVPKPLVITYQQSTDHSEKSDSNRVEQSQNSYQKNNKMLLQQLQFCRLMYYITKNIKYFPINDQKTKSFIVLTIFKHLLRCIKLLQQPNQNFPNQFTNFQTYQNNKQYKKLAQQIKNYCKRYEKQYLDILKNTQISTIRIVNRKFPELSYNSALNEQFYKNYYDYFTNILRILNHQISTNLKQADKLTLTASYQCLDSLYHYCLGIEQKMKVCQIKKYQTIINFNQKVVMDYRNCKLEKKDYQIVRLKIRSM